MCLWGDIAISIKDKLFLVLNTQIDMEMKDITFLHGLQYNAKRQSLSHIRIRVAPYAQLQTNIMKVVLIKKKTPHMEMLNYTKLDCS